MKCLHLLGALALFATAPAVAKGDAIAPPTAEELAALQVALDRGQSLYNYDQAAWHTTDTMREDVADLENSGIRGWVVTPTAEGRRVVYWRPDGDGYAGVYSAVWTGKKVRDRTVLKGDAVRLSEEQLSLIKARQVVDVSGLERCSDAQFNTVVLPGSNPQTFLVYMLTPQTSLSSIPFGGHYRFTVRDGEVIDQRSFTKSCLELELRSPKGDKLAALGVSHLLDPVPTEIHVFSMFAAEFPVAVITTSNEHIWMVEASGGQARVRVIR